MRIITIGREFGSGGRELGKRLADVLGIPCYDKEIIEEVAKQRGISVDQVEHISQADIGQMYYTTIGHSFLSPSYFGNVAMSVMTTQTEIIKRLAADGDCVIVGRQADEILKSMKPLNIFVYANKVSKLERCMDRANDGETVKEILKKMKEIDKSRASNRALLCGSKWGERENYHLCINTSDVEIKTIVPALAEYVNAWFREEV